MNWHNKGVPSLDERRKAVQAGVRIEYLDGPPCVRCGEVPIVGWAVNYPQVNHPMTEFYIRPDIKAWMRHDLSAL